MVDCYRWAEKGSDLKEYKSHDPKQSSKFQEYAPACCSVVPVLFEGDFNTENILVTMNHLEYEGSIAAPGFMDPEGVVIFHKHSNSLFKKTFDFDDKGKSYGN